MPATAQQYGITAPFGTPEYKAQEQQAIKAFTEDNRRALRKFLQREPTEGELYLAHQQGASGAKKLLSNPQAPAVDVVGEDAVTLNAGNPNMTAEKFASLWKSKFDEPTLSTTISNMTINQDLSMAMQEPDFSQMSDEELLSFLGEEPQQQDFSQMSDEELLSFLGEQPVDTVESEVTPDSKLGYALLAAPALEGLTFGFAPKIASAIGALPAKGVLEAREAITGIESPSLGDIYRRGVETYSGFGDQAREEMPILSTGAEIAGGLTSGIGLAKTAGAKALGTLAGRGGLAGRIGAGALAGEATQRVYEAGTGDVGEELETLTRGGISMGGILGGAIPAVGSAVRAGGSFLTPAIKDTAEETVNLAKKYNIPLGIDDLTGSKFYQNLIQKGGQLPFAGGTSAAENQLKAFTKAVARTVGLDDVDGLTPEAMDKAFDKIGGEFDKIAKGKIFTVSDDILDRMSTLVDDIDDASITPEVKTKIMKKLDTVFKSLSPDDTISGESLNKIRADLNKSARGATDNGLRSAYKDVENFVIDIMTEGNEEARQALTNAKFKYKNLIAIEPLAQKVQEEGIISPALLTNRVRQVYGRDFTRGRAGELGDLAKLGQVIKQKVPDSGTPIGNVMLGAMTGGNVPLAFISPTAAGLQASATGLGILANRAIQSRNVNPEVIRRLSQGAPALNALSGQRALGLGNVSGIISAQGE